MVKAKTRTIRLTDEQVAALGALADNLGISGQRGATFQPLIQWIANTSSRSPVETARALAGVADRADGKLLQE